jgi:aminoglycoside phosphotransferase (APT) family kinase protein
MIAVEERARIEAFVQEAIPGARVVGLRTLRGGLGGLTRAVRIQDLDHTTRTVTLRTYAGKEWMTPERLEREVRTLELLERAGVPAPRPLALDATGERFGAPAMLQTYLPGRPVVSPADPARWLAELARGLARVHSLTPELWDLSFLPVEGEKKARKEAENAPGEALAGDAFAQEVAEAARGAVERIAWLPHTLVHGDYWPGNVVMFRGRLAGVIDWPSVAVGDRRDDVAQCRLDLTLMYGLETADAFLAAYERVTGEKLHDVWLFDLLRGISALAHLPRVEKWLKGYHDLGLTGVTPDLAVERCRALLRRALAERRDPS